MFKKSLLLSTALLMAVLFVFTGCEGPTGPAGQQGSTEVGSVDVTIKGPDAAAPLLPEGVTYPDGNAKVLAGNAADIALAFNGGILVADTGDYGDGGPGLIQGGDATVYAQEPVDAVIWTGDGNKPGNLGSISVPPGKTLYINAPLSLGGGAGTFTSISISDAGTINASVAQQSLQGGAPVNTARGKVVLLSGGSITGTGAGSITNGGALELHRGSLINFPDYTSTFTAVSGSETLVYGEIAIGNAGANRHSFDGLLDIKAGGKVDPGLVILDPDFGVVPTIRGQIKVDGELEITNAVFFSGTIEVGETGQLDFDAEAGFSNEVTLNGKLDIDTHDLYLYGPQSHLKVTDKGTIVANTSWAQFKYNDVGNSADDTVLLAALADSSPNDDNFHITIATAGSGAIYLDVGPVEATSYANLVALAKSTTLHLEAIQYSGTVPAGADLLQVTKDNVVEYVSASASLGDITVEAGGALHVTLVALTPSIASAGNITVIGGGRPAVATFAAVTGAFTVPNDTTFATSLKSLTIGDTAGTATTVSFTGGYATLAGAGANSVITVHKNATLNLDPRVAVNPDGTIDLKGGTLNFSGDITVATPTTGFSALKKLFIEEGASFTAVDTTIPASPYPVNNVTFASLTELTVDGSLNVESNAISFAALQTYVSATTTDVKGNGRAVFSRWDVVAANHGHAFDQILGIKDVTVNTVTDVPNASGFSQATTPDRGTTSGPDYKLRVATITAPAGGLTIDRDLYVSGAINFGTAAAYPVTIGQGIGVYAGGALTLGGGGQSAPAVLTTTGANATLTAGAGVFNNSAALVLRSGDTLQIPGKLLIDTATFKAGSPTIAAAPTVNEVSLIGSANDTYLEKAVVSSVSPNAAGVSAATITVNAGGTLSSGAGSTVGIGSGVNVEKGGKIVSTFATGLTFSTGVVLGANATLSATGDGSSGVFNRTETRTVNAAPNVVFNVTEVTGAFTLSGGTFAQTATAAAPHNEFKLTGSIKVLRGLTEYDYAKLGSTLLNGVEFNGTAGTISLPANGTLGQKINLADGTYVSDGSAATLTTGGTGSLNLGTSAATAAALRTNAGPDRSLTLTGVILATNTIRGGSLDLSVGSLTTGAALTLDQTSLTLSGTGKLFVGHAVTLGGTTGSSITVSGNDAAIEFTATTNISLAALSTLKFGSYTITGATLIGSVTGGNIVIPTELVTVPLRTNDLYGPITAGATNVANLPTAITGSGLAIGGGGASVTIGGIAGKFINSDSKVYSTTL